MKDMPIFNLLLCAQIFDQIIRNFSLLAITVFLFPSSRSRFADSRWDVIQIHNSLVQITVEGGKAQIDYFIEVRPLRLEMLLFPTDALCRFIASPIKVDFYLLEKVSAGN